MNQHIVGLYKRWKGHDPQSIEALPLSGSSRNYFRIRDNEASYIAAYNADIEENNAFFYLSKHFAAKGLNVPIIYFIHPNKQYYILQDLGNDLLFDKVISLHRKKDFIGLKAIYKKVINQLIDFQIKGDEGVDYSNCFPVAAFDRQSMLWDLNYFKYYFLKRSGAQFNEFRLEKDFDKLTTFLLAEKNCYFMFRDFQARNILLHCDQIYFIDYQGGRKGALQYDLVSLLYQAKAQIPGQLREELLEYYISKVKLHIKIDEGAFIRNYYWFALIRTLQVLGAYGFRGFIEKKTHFLQSLPYAIQNFAFLLERLPVKTELPEIHHCIRQFQEMEWPEKKDYNSQVLNVEINSFSFRNEIPYDQSGNGGGFVFDCRVVPNPGRLDEYKKLSGLDQPVIDFLNHKAEVQQFKESMLQLASQSIDNYLSRSFNHLQFNFGCTGGQHRSVYFAEQLHRFLREHYGEKIHVILNHTRKKYWPK